MFIVDNVVNINKQKRENHPKSHDCYLSFFHFVSATISRTSFLSFSTSIHCAQTHERIRVVSRRTRGSVLPDDLSFENMGLLPAVSTLFMRDLL